MKTFSANFLTQDGKLNNIQHTIQERSKTSAQKYFKQYAKNNGLRYLEMISGTYDQLQSKITINI